jgi:hypothetical protein
MLRRVNRTELIPSSPSLKDGLISLMAAVSVNVEAGEIYECVGQLTEQRSYHFQVAIQEVVEHAKDDASKRLFRIIRRTRREEIEFRCARLRIIRSLRRRVAQDIVCDRNFLKRLSGEGVVGKFA